MGLTFGVYPLSIVGTPHGVAVGKPENPEEIARAMADLQGKASSLVPRMYLVYSGADSIPALHEQLGLFAAAHLKWNFVLCFRDPGTGLEEWLDFIRGVIRRHASIIEALEITCEPNLTRFGDGAMPNVRQALLQGVMTAKREARDCGEEVKIGFNAIPDRDGDRGFWKSLLQLGGRKFAEAVDFVGLNIYPDVFGGPVALDNLQETVERTIRDFRLGSLREAGIPQTTPIRLTENGWPTGPDRTEQRQSQVMEVIVRTVHSLGRELNITHYFLFALRDADSSNEDMFYQFGIMRDDYTPKPAFHTYRSLIRELSG